MRRSLPGTILVRTGLRLLRGYTGPAARAFAAAADDPAAAQRAVLARLVQGAAATGYGRHHGLQPDDDYPAFRDRLPVTTWSDLQPWLARERESPGALAPAPVQAWVRSGGNCGPAKHIPHTAALKRSRVLVSARHGRLRVSAHFYNNEADLERLEQGLLRALAAGA